MKIELPQRIESKSFLAEVYEVTAVQCFPLKNPNQKSIFGGTLRQCYIIVFFPFFLYSFILIAFYILILRLVKQQ